MKMEQEKLAKLIEKCRQGDSSAQESLIMLTQDRVYYHCLKMMKNEQDAQDAAQDVLITMITSLNKLRDPAAFWGWVNGITANRCKHLLTSPHKEWQIPEDEDGDSMLDSMENIDDSIVPDKALDNEETRRMIVGLVDELPPEQRMSVLFYYYDEMSVRDIAQAMGVSEGTVKSRLNYARKSIKNGVEEYQRQGIKLYGASPIVLLVYFLRKDAESAALSSIAKSSLVSSVMAKAGLTMKGAAGASLGSSGAAAAAGGAAKAVSSKIIAAVLAGAVALGGISAGVAALVNHGGDSGAPDQTIIEDGDAGDGLNAAGTSAVGFSGGVSIDADLYGAALVAPDGSYWMWGAPNYGTDEEGGPYYAVPEKIMEGVMDADISINSQAVLTANGNMSIEFWDGSTVDGLATGLENVVSMENGGYSFAAIDGTGSLWVWGANSLGELGTGTTDFINEPVKIMDNVVQVSFGSTHTAVLQADGSLWTCGDNGYGQLGDGTANGSLTFIKVMDDVAQVSCGNSFTLILKTDGSVWACGTDFYSGQLGPETDSDSSLAPLKIMDDAVFIDTSDSHCAAIKSDGTLWTWGGNGDGELGTGMKPEWYDDINPFYQSAEPVYVMDQVAAVGCGRSFTIAVRADGTVWAWGTNENGQMGAGAELESSDVPVQISLTLEDVGQLPWDEENASYSTVTDPAGPEPIAPAEDLEGAYTAYLAHLRENRTLIDQYADWFSYAGEIKSVALVDIMGDATPEMIYMDMDPQYTSDGYMNILTYQDGEVVNLYRQLVDVNAGGGYPFVLYQASDSRQLYYWSQYYIGDGQYPVLCQRVFEEAGGLLQVQEVMSGNGYLTLNGQEISRGEYDSIRETIPTEHIDVIMSNYTDVDGSSFQFRYNDVPAMTADEAEAYLTDALSQP